MQEGRADLGSEGQALALSVRLSAGLKCGHHNGFHFSILVVGIPGAARHDSSVLHDVVRQHLSNSHQSIVVMSCDGVM